MFSAIRSGRTDLGIGQVPIWICQRKMICAGLFPVFRGEVKHIRVGQRIERLPGRLGFLSVTLDTAYGRPRLRNDPQLLVGFAKFTLDEERVYLYLVHSRDVFGLLDKRAQMSRAEVAHANRLDSPFRQKLHRGFVVPLC